MRLTSKGQVTIPIDLRQELGLDTGSVVEFSRDGDSIRITKPADQQQRGSELVSYLRGRGDVELSTEEIMALTRGE